MTRPLPPQSVLTRHIDTGIAIHGYTAEQMRWYAAQEVTAELERWEGLARQALEVMEHYRSENAQGRITGVVNALRAQLDKLTTP
jgi:hypothetical protein